MPFWPKLTTLDSPAAVSATVGGRRVSESPTSNQALSLLRQWIQDCRENHPLCARPTNCPHSGDITDFPMPTRILDVNPGESGEIQLVVSDGTPHPYVALSHRWGKLEDVACTTTKNISERIKQISLASLSPLFRDAVEITRFLGIKYLWIDSLCIIQDDPEEWNQEAVRMSSTFQHAEIAISALRSEDGSSGFLGPRYEESVAIPFRKTAKKKIEGSILLRLGVSSFELEYGALNRRGWIFQERILPRRILSFSNKTTYFECQSLIRDEGSGTPWPTPRGGYASMNGPSGYRKFNSALEDLAIDPNSRNRESVFLQWRIMVQKLSELELTYERDRLPAFHGLAKRMERAVGTTYTHGLWTEDIILGLSWQVYLWPDSEILSPKSRSIPSWSWAASRGQQIAFLGTDRDICLFAKLAFPRKSWDGSLELKLEAPLKTCVLSQSLATRDFDSDSKFYTEYKRSSKTVAGPLTNILEDGSGQVIGAVMVDKEPLYFDTYQCILLYSCAGTDTQKLNYGLLLHAVEVGKFEFERIGLVYFNSSGFFNDASRVVVTLI